MALNSPLEQFHKEHGARMTEFAGWLLPLFYRSILEEHKAARNVGALFDISHMGKLLIRGPGAAKFVDHCFTNRAYELPIGQARYGFLCNENGGTIDDVYLYRLSKSEFLLIVNAARRQVDLDWLQLQADESPVLDGFDIIDFTLRWAALAAQGPAIRGWIDEVLPGGSISGTVVSAASELKKNQCAVLVKEGEPVGVACTGYTGEDGFELIGKPHIIELIAREFLERYQPNGLQLAGLGARDSLRLEMGYPLYGQELDERTSPIEAGLERFIAFDKGQFIGREALLQIRRRGTSRRLVGVMVEPGAPPPRRGCSIVDLSGQEIGSLTSGTLSPILNQGIGLAYVCSPFAQPNTRVTVRIRERLYPAIVVQPPFVRK